MRKAFVRALTDIARQDPRVVLLTGDLGFTVLEPFAEEFPDRFLNVGVAEQNMIGMATGLAEAGFLPYCYSIATFAVLRPYEFIRNGPLLHRLPVRIVGVGGGFEYGHAGPTHHAIEDIAVLRAQPGMVVVAPADHVQAHAAVRATASVPGPVYLRLGKDDVNQLEGLDGRFELGRAHRLRNGEDLAVISTGAVSLEAAAAVAALADVGVSASHTVVSSITPSPVDDLVEVLGGTALAVTVEAHTVNGGLGSLVCEVVAEHGLGTRVVRCGVRDRHAAVGGGEAFLNRAHGIGRAEIAATVLAHLRAPAR